MCNTEATGTHIPRAHFDTFVLSSFQDLLGNLEEFKHAGSSVLLLLLPMPVPVPVPVPAPVRCADLPRALHSDVLRKCYLSDPSYFGPDCDDCEFEVLCILTVFHLRPSEWYPDNEP